METGAIFGKKKLEDDLGRKDGKVKKEEAGGGQGK